MLKLTSNASNYLRHNYQAILLHDFARNLAYGFFSLCVISFAANQAAYANTGGQVDYPSMLGHGYYYVGYASNDTIQVTVDSTQGTYKNTPVTISEVYGSYGNTDKRVSVKIDLSNDNESLSFVYGIEQFSSQVAAAS